MSLFFYPTDSSIKAIAYDERVKGKNVYTKNVFHNQHKKIKPFCCESITLSVDRLTLGRCPALKVY